MRGVFWVFIMSLLVLGVAGLVAFGAGLLISSLLGLSAPWSWIIAGVLACGMVKFIYHRQNRPAVKE